MSADVSVRVAQEFLAWYAEELPLFEAAARELEAFLSKELRAENIALHTVVARAKAVDSVSAKMLSKQYSRPRSRLTDRIGARVILYHASDVDHVAQLLRKLLDVQERDSSDKRLALGLQEFGYKSYHLVGRLPQKMTGQLGFHALRSQVFEIQIRSVLEHAWAEIEHAVVYKSGAKLPDETKRRFAAIAGVLELLEHEFDDLVRARNGMIDAARQDIACPSGWGLELDVPHVLALLELRLPQGRSFRAARDNGVPFPPGIENRFVLALKLAGIRTVRTLDRALASQRVSRLRQTYASAEGVSLGEVSHLAMLAILLWARNRRALDVYFPEFRADAALQSAFNRTGKSL